MLVAKTEGKLLVYSKI